MKPLSKPQQRALTALQAGECVRNKEGWRAPAGDFIALPTMFSLRKRGLVRLSTDKWHCKITDAGRLAIPEVANVA